MKVKSYAKINIGLRIVNKRADGFHNIETFFQQIDLHDELDFVLTRDPEFNLSCSDENCPIDENNLVLKAAQILRKRLQTVSLGCRINLIKRIPMGAGLGGGSSNAAATLVALNHLWQANLTTAELNKLASQLGSDVPFFLHGGFAIGTGRGEILQKIKIETPYHGLLHCPNISISTQWAYKNLNLNLTNSDKIGKFVDFVPELSFPLKWKVALPNDLESVVFARYQHFQNILDNFYAAGAFYARMSGSGSTLFGLFNSLSDAQHAKASLAPKFQTHLFAPIYK